MQSVYVQAIQCLKNAYRVRSCIPSREPFVADIAFVGLFFGIYDILKPILEKDLGAVD